MLDSDLNVILLEINRSPDPSFNTAYQREMFHDLAKDSLSGELKNNNNILSFVNNLLNFKTEMLASVSHSFLKSEFKGV